MPHHIEPAEANTRRVILTLTGYRKVEYSECLEVPASISQHDLTLLVNQRYQAVSTDEYVDDHESWDYSGGTTELVHDDLELAATQRVTIENGQLVVTAID